MHAEPPIDSRVSPARQPPSESRLPGSAGVRSPLGRELLRELRPHQWLKNTLVFLPLLAAHRLFETSLWPGAALAFAAFTCCAAGIYVVNDLFDLEADRRDPVKRNRPLASGRLDLRVGRILPPLLFATGLALGWLAQPGVALAAALYVLTMLAYSLVLKAYPLLDVMTLAGGYAARVAAGAIAVGMPPSPWLLAFCAFLFLSLALLKRYAELVSRRGRAPDSSRGYLGDDAPVIAAEGIASGFVGVLVLALYTNTAMVQSPHGLYWIYWIICVLLLHWMSHLWLMAGRGRISEDPVSFALKDRLSRALLAMLFVLSLVAR